MSSPPVSPRSRRDFVRRAGGLALGGLAGRAGLGLGLAGLAALSSRASRSANPGGGYRALVCLFMLGGNDAHNWFVPIDPAEHAAYAAARGDLALPLAALQSPAGLVQDGRRFGTPAELAPLMRWYEQGRAAVVANVGPLVRPLTRAEFLAERDVPAKLFSHNDQVSTWQSLSPEGARAGWGGRIADLLMAANAQPLFTAVSAAGNAVFLSGRDVVQYQIGANGAARVRALDERWVTGSSTVGALLRETLVTAGDHPMAGEYARVMARSIAAEGVLSSAFGRVSVPPIPATPILGGAPLPTGSPATLDVDPLARQLSVVAQMIAAAPALGLQRQVFMVSLGAFDTHANQLRDHPVLTARVALSIDYFMGALQSLGLLDAVTLFTASDFGRTLVSNGDGSDHGWGAHHVVLGGGVRGGQIHGRFPVVATGTPDDVGSGRLLPGLSVVELAAQFGGWMGLSPAEQAEVLPGLSAFGQRMAPLMTA
ncbi:DUF1501 domain-containing protein [Piscinibacter sakaiensis]|nr:DUF1501 domain-containing protein [Piscinibacter sakaiensis]